MIIRPPARTRAPSRASLRILRRLALAGSTAGFIGSACTVAAISYEVNRRVRIAEQWVENKRNLQAACPTYDSKARMSTLAKMMEAAEAGEFMGLESMRLRQDKAREVTAAAEMDNPEGNKRVSTTPSSIAGHPQFSSVLKGGTRPSKRVPFSCSNHDLPPLPVYKTGKGKYLVVELIKQKNFIEASHHFFDYRDHGKVSASDSNIDLALKLFWGNIDQKNVLLARDFYRWLRDNGEVTSDVWITLLEHLAKGGNWESLSQTYCDYSARFALPKHLQARVLKALIESYRFQEAKDFVFKHLHEDRDCSLARFYLHRLRKKLRDVELVETQFRKLLHSLSDLDIQVTEGLFTPLLRIYVETGYLEKAKELVDTMRTVYHMEIGVIQLGYLAIGMAIKADWEGVDRIFQDIKALGSSEENSLRFRVAFDKIFLEYFLSHSGKEIRDFLFRAIEKYNLVPDQVLFDHILMAYIRKGDSTMVDEMVQTAKERKWNVRFNKNYFLDCLRSHRLACEKGVSGLWSMYSLAQDKKSGFPTVTNRILDFDKSSFPFSEAYKMPYTGEETRWWRKAMSLPQETKSINSYAPLERPMVHCIHGGDYKGAVDMFQRAKGAGSVVKPVHVRLAVIASLLKHGSTAEIKKILEDARATSPNCRDVIPVSLEMAINREKNVQRWMARRAIYMFYQLLTDHMLPIKHNAVVTLSSKLIAMDDPRYAMSLIRRVNYSRFGAVASFNDVGLQVIARGCANIGNFRGICWALLTALKRAGPPSKNFLAEIRRILVYLQSRGASLSSEEQERFSEEVTYIEFLLYCLTRKAEFTNDPTMRYERENSQLLKSVFSTDITSESALGGIGKAKLEELTTSTYNLLRTWDERVQLHKALLHVRDLGGSDDADAEDFSLSAEQPTLLS
ncbi:hypothetical protein VTO42DRAFT_6842 [Malbranchea cinnamomea]